MSQAESSLYHPVRDFLKAQGFTVHAEAHHCDVAAHKGDELVIVELKLALSIEHMAQGVERQKLSDTVYLAVPAPKTSAQAARLKGAYPILRKLELGLLTVDTADYVKVLVQPLPYQKRRKHKSRTALLTELAGRSGDDNLGGSNRTKLVTAYRENAVLVAVALHRLGPQTAKTLRTWGTSANTYSILSANYYEWFQKLGPGLYGLTDQGRTGLETWKTLAARKAPLIIEPTPKAPKPKKRKAPKRTK